MKLDMPGSTPVLDVLPEPVLLLRGGKVRYCNAAAGKLIPELVKGQQCPEPLAAVLSGLEPGAAAVCTIAGKQCGVFAAAIDKDTVVNLRVINPYGDRSRQWLSAFTDQVREQMTTLLAAAQQMEGEVREKGDGQQESGWRCSIKALTVCCAWWAQRN
jgi:hypothetical protein